MKLYSSGEVAKMLGIHRDKMDVAMRNRALTNPMKIGNRFAFSARDIGVLCDWFESRGTAIVRPDGSHPKTMNCPALQSTA